MDYIKKFWQRRRHKRVLSSIRKQMLFFGVDLSHVSDDEIERRLVEAAGRIARAGMPASDFARVFGDSENQHGKSEWLCLSRKGAISS